MVSIVWWKGIVWRKEENVVLNYLQLLWIKPFSSKTKVKIKSIKTQINYKKRGNNMY